MTFPLSLVIITYNEEKDIARCIQSVPWAQEIIVVDSLSQDKTKDIATALGARVIDQKFLGYREQKNFAVEQAKQEWILSLDADEALSPQLRRSIERALSKPKASGYRMARCSFYLRRWIRHGGWYPDYQLRLFRKGSGSWSGGAVHEHVQVLGPVKTLRGDLLHYVFDDLHEQTATNNEFSTLGAQNLLTKGEKFSLFKLLVRPFGKFFECYVWKRGFLDGAAGFIIALGAAQSLFLKYAKVWEQTL